MKPLKLKIFPGRNEVHIERGDGGDQFTVFLEALGYKVVTCQPVKPSKKGRASLPRRPLKK